MTNQLSTKSKVNLLGLTRAALRALFESLGEKPFRAEQVMKWLHHMGVDNFDEMTNLSKSLRAKLADIAVIEPPKVFQHTRSQDGTQKWVVELEGAGLVETVFIPVEGGRGTLCVSSQVGCALDCSFCSTGKQGYQRDLSAAEILGQVWLASKSFGQPKNRGQRPITNVVMMGMGEPLLNFDNVVAAMDIMRDDLGYGISKRRVTLSTSGIVPAIDKLYETIDVSLAVSLHAPNDELRNELVPVNKKYPLEELMGACKRYLDYYGDTRRITMEYVMIDQVNDRLEHADALIELLRDVPSKINLIPFNPFPNTQYRRSSNNAIRRFQDKLIKAGFTTTIRTTRGDDIDAACGQLVGQVADRTTRSLRWQQKIALQQQS